MCIKVITKILFGDSSIKSTHIQGSNTLILWRFQRRHLSSLVKKLQCNWIVNPIITILNILLGQLSSFRHLMSVRAFRTSGTFTPNIKTTNMCTVPLVIGGSSLKFQNSIVWPSLSKRGLIINTSSSLPIMLLGKIFPIHIALRNRIVGVDRQGSISNLNW